MADDRELLFFDTFSHENTEELNLDLVQFPRPVLITEVRVIPLGTRVKVDVPGGTRLGATNPSSFKLELFVTNLTKPNAATFESLGTLNYIGNENIQLVVNEKIPTDGVVIKGWYSAITIALYGCLTTVTRDKASPPPPPPPRVKCSQVVIPPSVVENAPTQLHTQPPPAIVAGAGGVGPAEWDPHSQPPPFAVTGPPPAPVPPAGVPPTGLVLVVPQVNVGAPPPQTDIYCRPPPNLPTGGVAPTPSVPQDTDERFPQGSGVPHVMPEQPKIEEKAPVKVVVGEDGEVKIPEGDYTNADDLFNAYLREKDRKKEEREREKVERERAERERYRREGGHSKSPDSRSHSRDRGRSLSRSRSRSEERDSYRKGSRDRGDKDHRSSEYRSSHRERDRDSDREYRDRDSDNHRESDRDYRERDRCSDRDRGKDRDSDRERVSDSKEVRDESRDRDRSRDSKDRQYKERERSDRKPSLDRELDRSRDSRSRERSTDRERSGKSPKSRGTPRRSRSRTPQRRSRSRSRDRNYERSGRTGRDQSDRDYSRDKERERDYDRGRDRGRDVSEKNRDYDGRSRDRDRSDRSDRDYRGEREPRGDVPGREERGRDYDGRGEGRERYDQRERDRTACDRERSARDVDRIRDSTRDTTRGVEATGSRDVSREAPVRDQRDSERGPDIGRDMNRDYCADGRGRDEWVDPARGPRDQYWNQRGGEQAQHVPNVMQPVPLSNIVVPAPGWGVNDERRGGNQWALGQPKEAAMGPSAAIPNEDEEESWEKTAEELYPAEDDPPPTNPQAPVHQAPTDDSAAPYDNSGGVGGGQHGPMGAGDQQASASHIDMYQALSDGEIDDGDAYSEISSEENWDELGDQGMGDWPPEMDDPANQVVVMFNPHQFYLTPMEKSQDPGLTEYEVEKERLRGVQPNTVLPPEAAAICEKLDKYSTQPHHHEWIEAMEQLILLLPLGLCYIVNKCDNMMTRLEQLMAHALEGLDVNKAMSQPLTAFKVRHLKMGIRLAGALCQCDVYVTLRFLSKEVQLKLLDLFESEHMSAPVKIQIVKALDSTTRLKDGLEWFMGKHPIQEMKAVSGDLSTPVRHVFACEAGQVTTEVQNALIELKTPYQRLVHVLTSKQTPPVAVALSALAKKIHTFELITRFTGLVEKVIKNTPCKPSPTTKDSDPIAESVSGPTTSVSGETSGNGGETGNSAKEEDDDLDVAEGEGEDALLPWENMAQPEELESVVQCLQKITNIYLNADFLIGQPRRTLPIELRFAVLKEPFDAYPTLYHMLSCAGVLECVYLLLASPATHGSTAVFGAVRGFLLSILSRQCGMQYLCANHETVNGITHTLAQQQAFSEEEEDSRAATQKLGLEMIYSLHILQCIDRLNSYHALDSRNKTVDDAEPLGVLHILYVMTFTPLARQSMVDVFTKADNLASLFPFIEFTDDDEHNIRLKRSVCHSYTVMLLQIIVRHADRVDYLETFGSRLLAFTQSDSSSKSSERIQELHDWLSPLQKIPSFSRDEATVADLLKILKTHHEEAAHLPKALITVLRILEHMCIEPELPVSGMTSASPKELKYKYVIIELFHGDVMPMFVAILQKISASLTRSFQGCLPVMGQRKLLVLSIVRPTLVMMKAILSNLIAARDSEFQDRTVLPCLFQLHTVVCSVSHAGSLPSELQDIQNLIVDTLATYTQPSLMSPTTSDDIAKSLWTQMVKDLLRYVLTSPYTFLSGLILLSELLPVPLPVQTKEPLSEGEVLIIVNQRKLWAAHLHPLANEIQDLLRCLCGSACQPLQQLLRRVCWQLADLASSSALLVVRGLVDTLLESIGAAEQAADAIRGNTIDESQELRCSSETAKILNLLAFLINQPPVKAAFIHLTSKIGSSEDRYGSVLEKLAERLNGVSSNKCHLSAQESIVVIFQTLFDLEVTMVPSDAGLSFVEQLSNSLPGRDEMALICRSLLQHINQPDHNFSSVLPALRTLALLMMHDYGFYHVKKAIDAVPRAFYSLFERINNTFSKDSSDCIATLSSAIELLQFLVALPEAPEGEEQTVPFDRTYLITYSELRTVLQWRKEPCHPLADLESLLKLCAEEDETLKAVYESLDLILSILESEEDQPPTDMSEPSFVIQENLQAQFGLRSVYMVTDEEDERLSATYWLDTPMLVDVEDAPDSEPAPSVDLLEMAQKYCQDLDVKAELEKNALPLDPAVAKSRRKSRLGRRGGQDTINTSKHRTGNRGGYLAPMRGRGFGRGMSMPVNKNDTFRSRPQNTSRPPSMHVDDFIKMELQGGSAPIGPTGMNPHLMQFREQIHDHGRGGMRGGRGGFDRGRGRGGGMPDRQGGRGGTRHFGQGQGNKYGGMGGYDSGASMMGGRGGGGGGMFGMKRGGGGMRGAGGGASSMATGGYMRGMGAGQQQQKTMPWNSRPTRPPPAPRNFDRGGVDGMSGGGGAVFGRGGVRGGGGSGGWRGAGGWRGGRDGHRFGTMLNTPQPNMGLRRDNSRHQRSFTK